MRWHRHRLHEKLEILVTPSPRSVTANALVPITGPTGPAVDASLGNRRA